jgi:site-specific recombinase XerD
MPFKPGDTPPNAGGTYKPQPLTEDEVQLLLRQCSTRAPTGIRNRAIITMMYRAGLRVQETLDLEAHQVDMRRGSVHVLHGKKDNDRWVGLDDGALAVMQLWLDRRRELGLAKRGVKLFCTLDGGAVSQVYVRAMLRRIAVKAGIEKRVHPHGLRHTFASEQVDEGVPVTVIQAELGHRWLSTTQGYLGRIAPATVIARGRAREWAAAPGKPSRRKRGEPDDQAAEAAS